MIMSENQGSLDKDPRYWREVSAGFSVDKDKLPKPYTRRKRGWRGWLLRQTEVVDIMGTLKRKVEESREDLLTVCDVNNGLL